MTGASRARCALLQTFQKFFAPALRGVKYRTLCLIRHINLRACKRAHSQSSTLFACPFLVASRLRTLLCLEILCYRSVVLDDLQLKNPHSFMMVGAPDEAMMLQVSQIDDLPEIINDLDQDFAYDSREQLEFIANAGERPALFFFSQPLLCFPAPVCVHLCLRSRASLICHVAGGATENQAKLKKCVKNAEINTMNPPRTGKHLLVLDLDHTLLHLKDRFAHKRPHCIEFLRELQAQKCHPWH